MSVHKVAKLLYWCNVQVIQHTFIAPILGQAGETALNKREIFALMELTL